MKFIAIAKTLARYWRMAKDPATPPIVRWLIYVGIGYSIMPFDLLPDWVPILGLLDDAAVLPSIIALAMLMIPKEVKRRHNAEEAREIVQKKAEGRITAEQAETEMETLQATRRMLG